MDQVQVATKRKTVQLVSWTHVRRCNAPKRGVHLKTLPMPDDRPGWTHRYIRISTMGTADPSNISSKLREGYEPCKAEDYPELMMHASIEGRFKGGVEVGGLLLCRIPEEFMTQRAKYYENLNKSQVDSVDNNFLRENDPRMPLFSEKRTKVTFGSGT
jgi:hypothetical protein